jgi:D-alanine transaminase
MPRFAYVNGQYVPHKDAAVHIEDRGFQFADSVYEVIACMDGRLADEQGHLDRLERSLKELRMEMPMPRNAMKLVIREFIRRNKLKNASVYMQVTRGVAARDFKFPDAPDYSFVMTIYPATFNLENRKTVARKAYTTPDIRWKRRDIKSTALLAQVLSKQSAIDKGGYEAWMVDDDGYITEGSSTNAWIVDKKGNLVTRPTANNSILKGVTRNAMQALLKKEGVKIVERAFTPKEVYEAQEAFSSAAVALIMPIVEMDGKKIGSGKPGPLTLKILEWYMNYAKDNAADQHVWTPA